MRFYLDASYLSNFSILQILPAKPILRILLKTRRKQDMQDRLRQQDR